MKTRNNNRTGRGFTLVELLAIIAVLVVIVLIAVPANRNEPVRHDRIKCVNNLKNVGLALRIFATDNGDHFPMALSTNEGGSFEYANTTEVFRHFQIISNELSTPKILICPADDRKEASNFNVLRNENLSYFLGLNSSQAQPQSILAGDRNLTTNGVAVRNGIIELPTNSVVGWSPKLHNGQGNIALGDGSVQQASNRRLQDQIATSEMSTVRLAVP